MKSKFHHSKLMFVAALLSAGLVGCVNTPEHRSVQQTAADTALTAKVNAALDADAVVKGSRINVSSTYGVVTMRGIAPSPAAKQEAVNVARHVDGVREVRDAVVVGRV